MKIENTTTHVESTITTEKITLGIDADGMNHVLSVLSNLYSDPELAVLREYSTNALDSHIQAGQTLPIYVTSPTPISPQLTIQDFGIGMSKDDIVRTYSRYGSSTKRDSNEQVGAFGVGAKSAFTIASQFTVTGVKQGIKTVVLFSLTEDHTPVLQVLQEVCVKEPNGVKVSIPISNVKKMLEKIETFFYVWRPGTVIVDHKEPINIFTDPDIVKIDECTYLQKVDTSLESWKRKNTINLIMGGVCYPVESSVLFGAVQRGTTIHVLLPIGAIDIAPSREAIKETPKSLHTIKEVEQWVRLSWVNREEEEILKLKANHTPLPEMARQSTLWGEMKGVSSNNEWTKHNKKWELEKLYPEHPGIGPINTADPIYDLELVLPLYPERLANYIVITECDTPRKAQLIHNRGEKWAKHFSKNTPTPIPSRVTRGRIEWFTYGVPGGVPTKSYKEFKAEASTLYKKPDYTPGGRRELTYNSKMASDAYDKDRTIDELEAALKGRKLLLLEASWSYLENLDDSYVQIRLNGRQNYGIAVKRFGTPEDYIETRKKQKEKLLSSLTEPQKQALRLARVDNHREIKELIRSLDPCAVNNPRVKKVIETIQILNGMPDNLRTLQDPSLAATKTEAKEWEWIDWGWPLLKHIRRPSTMSDSMAKEIVRYLNA